MPNTAPVVDTAEWVDMAATIPSAAAVVNVFPIAAATRGSKGGTLTDFSALQRAGAVAVTDDGKPILDDDIMRMALRLGAELNFPWCSTPKTRDSPKTARCTPVQPASDWACAPCRPPPKPHIVDRDVTLAQQIRESRLHVAHLSTADALKAVRRGKRAQGARHL